LTLSVLPLRVLALPIGGVPHSRYLSCFPAMGSTRRYLTGVLPLLRVRCENVSHSMGTCTPFCISILVYSPFSSPFYPQESAICGKLIHSSHTLSTEFPSYPHFYAHTLPSGAKTVQRKGEYPMSDGPEVLTMCEIPGASPVTS
jgi:hypothetical protein